MTGDRAGNSAPPATVAATVALQLYSVTPETVRADDPDGVGFPSRLEESIRAAEAMGCTGMLVPQNMHEIDPWVVAGALGATSTSLLPLIAMQPAMMPPHTAAAASAAFAALYGRPVLFNLVAGAREDEMAAIGDSLDHDRRYRRLSAFARLTRALLVGERIHGDGEFYHYDGHRLEPRPQVLDLCRFFVAGSSPASRATAVEAADVVISHPAPVSDWRHDAVDPLIEAGFTGDLGIRIGILCRDDADEAWKIARTRFPETWMGTQETKLKTLSTNSWSRDLAKRALAQSDDEPDAERDVYWLGAFKSGSASAPFLVGSTAAVARRLAEYVDVGVGHIVLNGTEPADHSHIRAAMDVALGGDASAAAAPQPGARSHQ